ncbi:MAG: NIPSNAP family protein [Candidatus Tectomicrobia bacterium]|nr:NIPSNAP family protein [Candidatus Tectomicrobia bacterium]
MIYEIRTYDLSAGMVPEFERSFAAVLPKRTVYSPLLALWHTEIGPLNQVIHIWPYESLQQRDEVRLASRQTQEWPPKFPPNTILRQHTMIAKPAPFSPEPQPQETGGVFEVRTYTYRPGTLPEVLKRFGEVMPKRVTISPLVAAFTSEFGALNQFIHIWAYPDLNARAKLRAEASKQDYWPPKTRDFMLSQEVKICLPAACSPLR